MSIQDAEIIDFISMEKGKNKVRLTISDHLEWEANNEHLYLLQNKLNAYIGFIESGELVDTYPDAEGKDILICIVTKHYPNIEGLKFMNTAKKTIEPLGIELTIETFNE